jgi:hypothetical protein
MENGHRSDGLRSAIRSMLALETRLEDAVARLAPGVERYPEASMILGELRQQVTKHRNALEAQLQEPPGTETVALGKEIVEAFEPASSNRGSIEPRGAVRMLGALATELARAAVGYAALHSLAHRAYWIPIANLADEHRVGCLRAVHAVHRALADVVVQELQEAGQTCRCECPSCAPGICLCWHVHADLAEPPPTEGIVVRSPRSGSNAERAGLRHRDVILAVEAREIHSYQDMLDRMREHEPGAAVRLRIRRGTSEPREVVITR